MITVHVPAMTARADARLVSTSISDVPGVRTLWVDLTARTVRVTGPADPAAVIAAITATGYAAAANPGEIAGERDPAHGDSGC